MSFCHISHLSAGYGSKSVLEDISFSVEKGSLLGILGANGSGKTTLLKSICGILPHRGSCEVEGQRLEALSARKRAALCSYIPQRSGISIDISVLDVVLMGFNPRLGLLEYPSPAMRQRALEALALAGLAGKEGENYLHLSEGQKQLCILARTLVSDARLLLLDEPESALDLQFRYRMLRTLSSWVNKQDSCAILSLHDPTLALRYCHRLLLLSHGKLLGSVSPASTPLPEMERLLGELYGRVSLQRCRLAGGYALVMLKEEEEQLWGLSESGILPGILPYTAKTDPTRRNIQ